MVACAFAEELAGECVRGCEAERVGARVGEGESACACPVFDVVAGEGGPGVEELACGDFDGGVGDVL